MNNSPSNIFNQCFCLERYHKNSQAVLAAGCLLQVLNGLKKTQDELVSFPSGCAMNLLVPMLGWLLFMHQCQWNNIDPRSLFSHVRKVRNLQRFSWNTTTWFCIAEKYAAWRGKDMVHQSVMQDFNPYAAGDQFGQYKMMQNTWIMAKPLAQLGTHLRVLSESFHMNTNMTEFRWFSKGFAFFCFGRKWPQPWKD